MGNTKRSKSPTRAQINVDKGHSKTQVHQVINLLQESILDQLRACKTPEQLLELDKQITFETELGPLYRVICDFLKHKAIAPIEAANWLGTLMDNREQLLEDCLTTTCKLSN